jgi:hypothetical protein
MTFIIELNVNKILLVDVMLFFFFPKIYTVSLEFRNIGRVLEYSMCELFHPVFYDSMNRINFVHLVIEYRNKNKRVFRTDLNLSNTIHTYFDGLIICLIYLYIYICDGLKQATNTIDLKWFYYFKKRDKKLSGYIITVEHSRSTQSLTFSFSSSFSLILFLKYAKKLLMSL